MDTDIPKLPQKPQYVIEASFNARAGNDNATNDISKRPETEAENWGGQFVFTNGTATSGTSLSTVQSQQISFIPSDGAIPSYVFELNQVARNLEQIINPTKK